MSARLPVTALDILKFSPKEWIIYHSAILFYKFTGLWRFPIPTNGDIEAMTPKDAVYWVYKAKYPIKRAEKGSGLETFFKEQASFQWKIPAGFKPHEELQLSAVGDLMDHAYLANSSGVLYQGVVDTIFGSDISMANLECVIFPQGSKAFEISTKAAPPLYYKTENFNAVKGTQDRKYSFMSTAGNHSLDCGEEGVASTISALRVEGITFHGMNETEEESKSATILHKNGFKIGVISFAFGLNGKKAPEKKPWIVNRARLNGKVSEADFSTIKAQVNFAREKNVDIIIAQLHWGLEHELYPRPEQLEVAHHLAEMGVDIIIGHHPHVIQPMECYRTKRDPDRVVPIYYSLGNLITPFSLPVFRKSGVARITLAKGQTREGKTQTYVQFAKMAEVYQEIDEVSKTITLRNV